MNKNTRAGGAGRRLIAVIRLSLPLFLSCLLVACGGGGGGDGGGSQIPPPAGTTPQAQTIAFAQSGPIDWSLSGGNFTNAATGGAGTGAITYQTSNPAIATVNATTGVVTPVAAGTVQITASKAADSAYQAATATYTLHITAPGAAAFTALIGAQDAQIAFSPAASGLEFLRTSQSDCNVAQIATCANGRVDTITAATLTDATTTLSTDATYWLRSGTRTSAPTFVSQRRFPARARVTLASFKGKLWAFGGQQTDISLTHDVWATDDGVTWKLMNGDAEFGYRARPAVVELNDRLWVIGGEGGGGTLNDAYKRDVWSSADGIHWQLAVALAPYPNRFFHAAAAFNGKLWVIGGSAESNTWGDVWSSPDGVAWTRVLSQGPFGTRENHTLTVFNGKLWLIAGTSSGVKNDVWSTADGANWTLETANAAFPARTGHGAGVMNGRLWVFGGNDVNNDELRDVWSSADGVTWQQMSADATYPKRSLFGATAHNGRLWIAGGELAPVQTVGAALWLFNTDDVWSTADGVQWTQATPYAPMFAGMYNTRVFNGKLWIVGGSDLSSARNDVWSSTDGATWTPSVQQPAFTARASGAVTVHNNQLWVIGGATPSGTTTAPSNDVWRSTDGSAWTQVTPAATFSARAGHSVVSFKNQMILIGGRDASAYLNDVWASSDGASWTQLTAAAPFAVRAQMQVTVHGDRLWLVGGLNSSANLTDAWSSADGINWQLATATVPHLPFGGISLASHGGKLWLTGGMKVDPNFGYTQLVFSNAVWSSADGATWTREADGLFTGRRGAQLVDYDNKLWVLGGQDRFGPKNDVWSSVDGTNWRVRYSGTIQLP